MSKIEEFSSRLKELMARFNPKAPKGKDGPAPPPQKNACPQCGTGFMPWINHCTRCKIPLQG